MNHTYCQIAHYYKEKITGTQASVRKLYNATLEG